MVSIWGKTPKKVTNKSFKSIFQNEGNTLYHTKKGLVDISISFENKDVLQSNFV